MNSKEYFFDQVIKEVNGGGTIRVLELGCGTAAYVPAMIKKYPQLEYVGIEPIEASYKNAQKNLSETPRTKISMQLGYDFIPGLDDSSFDVVISFSVLEHVKQLGRFMALSARYAKPGALVVHRYDLGHALYPVSLKEHLHVMLGNSIPAMLPERKFVRYVPLQEVKDLYKEVIGDFPYKYTYHQMPDHKELAKVLDKSAASSEVMEELYAWEMKNAGMFHAMPIRKRERLFPTIAVWGKKSK